MISTLPIPCLGLTFFANLHNFMILLDKGKDSMLSEFDPAHVPYVLELVSPDEDHK